jgi:para-nitrobenzyl esterase
MSFRRFLAVACMALLACVSPARVTPPTMVPLPKSPPAAASRGDEVLIKQGVLQGAADGRTFAFRGIPYALAPVGDRRWRPPSPPEAWSGTRSARTYGSVCPQLKAGSVIGDEDCLFLNVWTPERSANQLPVMVFLHGGFNLVGGSSLDSGGDSQLEGRYLAEHGPAIVVTLNYRLGVLGFLALHSLSAESPQHRAGNYGLLDQIAALRWVKDNIAAFGGDPERVLLFGESAGAIDTSALLVSPLARGLFSRALLESGFVLGFPAEQVEGAGQALPRTVGCGGTAEIRCLREKPFDTLVRAMPSAISSGLILAVVADGEVVPRSPLEAIRAGQQAHVPIVVGSNADEFSTLMLHEPPRTPLASQADLASEVRVAIRERPEAILARYPAAAYGSARAAYVALRTDQAFSCPTRRVLRALVAGQTEPAFRYVFSRVRERGPLRQFGAGHALEIPFVFHTFLPGAATDADLDLSDHVVASWTQFAAIGDPSARGVRWPRYDAATDPYVRLDDPVRVEAGFRSAECDDWDLAGPSSLPAGGNVAPRRLAL